MATAYTAAPEPTTSHSYGKKSSFSDVEAGGAGAPGAGDAYFQKMEGAVRQGFIKKVYALLSIMLLVTFSTVALFSLVDAVRGFIEKSPAILGLAFAAYIASAVALTCCGDSVRRNYPTNYIVLAIFTCATSVMVGVVSATYAPASVALAAGLTLGIFLGLTAFAAQTKIDFTPLNQGLCSVVWGLVLFGLACAFFPGLGVMRTLYAALGAILFSFFIIIDTQMLLGGKREVQLGPDDYVMAALQLYRALGRGGARRVGVGRRARGAPPPSKHFLTTQSPPFFCAVDVVNLFLKLLQLLGSKRN